MPASTAAATAVIVAIGRHSALLSYLSAASSLKVPGGPRKARRLAVIRGKSYYVAAGERFVSKRPRLLFGPRPSPGRDVALRVAEPPRLLFVPSHPRRIPSRTGDCATLGSLRAQNDIGRSRRGFVRQVSDTARKGRQALGGRIRDHSCRVRSRPGAR